jgi:hypothetical protein
VQGPRLSDEVIAAERRYTDEKIMSILQASSIEALTQGTCTI